jgi:proline iminopeptidase
MAKKHSTIARQKNRPKTRSESRARPAAPRTARAANRVVKKAPSARKGAGPKASQTLRNLYPEIEPYRTGYLKVSDVHEIYFEESGNPRGKPAVF